MEVRLKQIKISDRVAVVLDKRRGKRQLTYSEAIEEYITKLSLLNRVKRLLGKIRILSQQECQPPERARRLKPYKRTEVVTGWHKPYEH